MNYTLMALCLCFAQVSFGQLWQQATNTGLYNKDNIYYQTLKEYIGYQARDRTVDTLYLEEDYKLTDSIWPECDGTTIIKVKRAGLANLVAKKKTILLCRIMPLTFREGVFSITLLPLSCGLLNHVLPGAWKTTNPKVHRLYVGEFFVTFSFDGAAFELDRYEMRPFNPLLSYSPIYSNKLLSK
jgi:hypothetical protein